MGIKDKKLINVSGGALGTATDACIFYSEKDGVPYNVTGSVLKAYFSNGQIADKGFFATSAALNVAYPTGEDGYFAVVGATDTIWIWDSDTSSWVDSGTASSSVGVASNSEFDGASTSKAASPSQIQTRSQNLIQIDTSTDTTFWGSATTLLKAAILALGVAVKDLQTTIANKLTKNTAITADTKTKVTYDANGLVTAGTDATATDIVNTPTGNISATNVQDALNELDNEKVNTSDKSTLVQYRASTSDKWIDADLLYALIGDDTQLEDLGITLYDKLVEVFNRVGNYALRTTGLTADLDNQHVSFFQRATITANATVTVSNKPVISSLALEPAFVFGYFLITKNTAADCVITVSGGTLVGSNTLSGASGSKFLIEYRAICNNVSTEDVFVIHGNSSSGSGSSDPTLGGELSGTASSATLENSAVIGKVLTGYAATSGIVSATDSILQAIQKIGHSLSNMAIRKTYTQSSHGFSVGDILKKTGGVWSKALADSETNAEAIGVVESVADANTFTVVFSGIISLSSLTADTSYYLSDTVSGTYTTTKPTTTGTVVTKIFRAISTTEAIVNIQSGYINA